MLFFIHQTLRTGNSALVYTRSSEQDSVRFLFNQASVKEFEISRTFPTCEGFKKRSPTRLFGITISHQINSHHIGKRFPTERTLGDRRGAFGTRYYMPTGRESRIVFVDITNLARPTGV